MVGLFKVNHSLTPSSVVVPPFSGGVTKPRLSSFILYLKTPTNKDITFTKLRFTNTPIKLSILRTLVNHYGGLLIYPKGV